MSEKVLDEENWKTEANAVINDIKSHVKYIKISETLRSNDHRIYLNITTIENQNYCIELSGLGFKVAGKEFDKTDENTEEYFETPYSLLNSISPSFKDSFGSALLEKLNCLQTFTT